ncbi:uncharacterized protein ACA1_398320 [Acanthamoeba castellanii str. Neff]|uniref:Uncharacterized protein n=1 Tax=Acanthamoeba castellanii (strain ATCC 30010 / Neff) TaxID=1257118 RepID=L8HEQ7_ACACF|nr:uncharacterized protein ACA1_398320 [Acanthamoeba castellanii str. Neff]ELR22896.1 hypothetical protein ACA1_398320 [Acanthamoeba castellanii str. Neff]
MEGSAEAKVEQKEGQPGWDEYALLHARRPSGDEDVQHRIRIKQVPGSGTTGGIVWNAAKVLLQLLGAEEGEGGIRVGGRRVMDLGSGTGLLGLVENVALNLRALPEGSVEPEVQALEWGGEVAHLAPPFDLVVCSDLVFCAHNAGCLPALLHAILTLSEEGTEVVVAFQERLGWIEARFMEEVKRHFGQCREVEISEAALQRATAREGEEEFEGMSSMFHEDIGMHVYLLSHKLSSPAPSPSS